MSSKNKDLSCTPLSPTTLRRTYLRAMLRNTILLALGGTLACASSSGGVISRHGFRLDNVEDALAVDKIWFEVADAATSDFRELAQINLAMQSLGFDIVFTEAAVHLSSRELFVPREACLANSPLVSIFGALISNIMHRDVMPAMERAKAKLSVGCDFVEPEPVAAPEVVTKKPGRDVRYAPR